MIMFSEKSVRWLTMISWLCQCFLELPCAFLATKVSLRSLILSGCSLSLIGSVIKNTAISTDLFPLLFVGQVISQLPWALGVSRAGQLANMWCYAHEISLATVIGSTGIMLGTGLGFLVPIFIIQVPHQNDVMDLMPENYDIVIIKNQLTVLYSISTGISAFILLTMLCLYRHDPDTPPTNAERKRSLHVSRRQSSIFEGAFTGAAIIGGAFTGSVPHSPTIFPQSKMTRFRCDLKIFWEETKSIGLNRNWRLLLGSFTLINGCIEAFQVELGA